MPLLQLGQEWLWFGRVGLGFESRRFSLYHIPPYVHEAATEAPAGHWAGMRHALVPRRART
eukprot:5308472-Prymnesium_polylepis.1